MKIENDPVIISEGLLLEHRCYMFVHGLCRLHGKVFFFPIEDRGQKTRLFIDLQPWIFKGRPTHNELAIDLTPSKTLIIFVQEAKFKLTIKPTEKHVFFYTVVHSGKIYLPL